MLLQVERPILSGAPDAIRASPPPATRLRSRPATLTQYLSTTRRGADQEASSPDADLTAGTCEGCPQGSPDCPVLRGTQTHPKPASGSASGLPLHAPAPLYQGPGIPSVCRAVQSRAAYCNQWARVVSNHRPLACEASALPLSYAPEGPANRYVLRAPAVTFNPRNVPLITGSFGDENDSSPKSCLRAARWPELTRQMLAHAEPSARVPFVRRRPELLLWSSPALGFPR